MVTRPKQRTYRKAARAESEAETRQRIVEATVALHEEVGPARTTISAIADRAGVQRLTVYRHFPDDAAIFEACSSHWTAQHPAPDISAIRIRNNGRRAKSIILALYRYYRGTGMMLDRVLKDVETMPSLVPSVSPVRDYLENVASEIERCWPRKSRRRSATIRHVVQLETWRSLTQLTSDDEEAADLAFDWIRFAKT